MGLGDLVVLSRGSGLVGAKELGLLELVELVLLPVKVLEAEPEGDTTEEGDDGDGGVVPDEEGVLGQRSPGLADGRRDGTHGQVDGHDKGLHVLGGLGESVLVRGDVGEDLSETDENVGETLSPDVDGSRTLLADGGQVAARRHLVDVVLHDGGGNHGGGGEEETSGHTLDGSEVETHLAETGVDKVIKDGDHDDDGEGVQVLDNIVGGTVQDHRTSLGGQVVGHLVVGEEEDGQEEEDLAGLETTADFVNPGVIVSQPAGALSNGDVAGLRVLPVQLGDTARALRSKVGHAEELLENGAGRGSEVVLLLVGPEDNGADEEEDGGQEEGQPEAVVFLNEDHGDLTADGTAVDGKVEPQEDTGVGDGGVDNDTLAAAGLNAHAGVLVLLSEQGRNVRLEQTSTAAKSEETEEERGEGDLALGDDGGSGGDSQDNVSDSGNGDGDVNDLVTTQLGVGQPTTGLTSQSLFFRQGFT